ncbi:sporulation protein [Streptomyces sp. NBC_01255]|uniref:sporulation protein n=1 Tax=Streptomyces sp. NBC_01255 TaxID=2903798 RepID=UPI002E30D868|nr:sporulation protein [Streptomyces sp. NBC_01255]
MVFKRLLGRGGIPLEIDTIIQSGPTQPGGILTGEVVLRAPERDVEVKSISLRLAANVSMAHKGDGDGERSGDTFDYPSVSSWFTLKKGEERRLPIKHRLKWESPLSEVKGQEVGLLLGLNTEVEAEGIKAQTDDDLVRVTSTPLHDAVFDAFAAEGYELRTSRTVSEMIPRTEYHVYLVQSFLLVDQSPGGEKRPKNLELVFRANPVGCEIYLRRGDLGQKYWEKKAPALRYVAAHHDLGRVDFEAEVRRWISEVTLLGDRNDSGDEG